MNKFRKLYGSFIAVFSGFLLIFAIPMLFISLASVAGDPGVLLWLIPSLIVISGIYIGNLISSDKQIHIYIKIYSIIPFLLYCGIIGYLLYSAYTSINSF